MWQIHPGAPSGSPLGPVTSWLFVHFPFRASCMRFIRVSPPCWEAQPTGKATELGSVVLEVGQSVPGCSCPAAHSEQPAMNWPLGTSYQEPWDWKRRRLSVSKRGQTREAGPQGSPEQVSEGHWNRRTGVKRGPEVGEEAETPARHGRGVGNRSAETDRTGEPEGPSPRRQTSDKKFQTLTASFREPEM